MDFWHSARRRLPSGPPRSAVTTDLEAISPSNPAPVVTRYHLPIAQTALQTQFQARYMNHVKVVDFRYMSYISREAPCPESVIASTHALAALGGPLGLSPAAWALDEFMPPLVDF